MPVFTERDAYIVIGVIVGTLAMLLAAWWDYWHNRDFYEMGEDWTPWPDYSGKGER